MSSNCLSFIKYLCFYFLNADAVVFPPEDFWVQLEKCGYLSLSLKKRKHYISMCFLWVLKHTLLKHKNVVKKKLLSCLTHSISRYEYIVLRIYTHSCNVMNNKVRGGPRTTTIYTELHNKSCRRTARSTICPFFT